MVKKQKVKMTSSNSTPIHFKQESIEDLDSNFLQFQNGKIILKKVVFGRIVNSVPSPNDKENQLETKCRECGMEFSESERMIRHMIKAHTKKKPSCNC